MNDMHATAGVRNKVADITHNASSHREGYPVGSFLLTHKLQYGQCVPGIDINHGGNSSLKAIKSVPLLHYICVAHTGELKQNKVNIGLVNVH